MVINLIVKKDISKSKSELMDQGSLIVKMTKMVSLIHSLLGIKKSTVLPEYTSSFTLASTINMFFIDIINTIKMEFPPLEACLTVYSVVDNNACMHCCF